MAIAAAPHEAAAAARGPDHGEQQERMDRPEDPIGRKSEAAVELRQAPFDLCHADGSDELPGDATLTIRDRGPMRVACSSPGTERWSGVCTRRPWGASSGGTAG